MKLYSKSWTIQLPLSMEKAWDFFSRPENLEHLTPKDMRFIIHTEMNEKNMYQGMMINYTVTPLLNFPMNWTTEITHIQPYTYFVDEQRAGPYKIWHHEHHFKIISGGIEMTDLLHYALPYGILGRWLNTLFISAKIDRIFAYREKELKIRFA